MQVTLVVCIDVPDLGRGIAFYTGAGVGLVVRRRVGDDLAELAGASLEGPVVSAAWGRMANLADPFGHGFCLVELGPRRLRNALFAGDGA